MLDAVLETRLFASSSSKRGHRRQNESDWATVHHELKRNRHVILAMLWEEYIACQLYGYRYSRYCQLYRQMGRTLSAMMRQTNKAGDKLFVDHARDGVPVVVDRRTSEYRSARIFVAVLGASTLTIRTDRPPYDPVMMFNPAQICGLHKRQASARSGLSRSNV